jgi:hypothetical protein
MTEVDAFFTGHLQPIWPVPDGSLWCRPTRHDDIIITVQKYERGVGGNRGHGSVPRKGKSKNAL